jgi:NADPH:quinone reductase
MHAHRIVMTEPGPPEVLRYEAVALAAPGPGEVLLRHTAIGLNYIDIQHRAGRYALPHYPSPIGLEAAGVVEAVGPGVSALEPGQRVAYGSGPIGAYAEARLIPAEKLVALPSGIDDATAAAVMIKG